MVQRSSRLIAGIYHVGQILSSGPLLTTCTAYNRNTSDVVGLQIVALPAGYNPSVALQLLASLERRRALQSPHVIRVHDWGVYEGRAYIATDPPRGITLSQLEASEHIDLARALNLASQATRGVAVLQTQGIVDTDLRPQMLTVDTVGLNDRVQVDDVGLRLLFRQLGYVQGMNMYDIGYLDQRYLAPESIYQGTISSASDIYQLGILLFELVTGRPPFVGRTPAETGIMQHSSPVPRMTQFKHDTPPELQTVVERALAKDPMQRYPHAVAMLTALDAVPRPSNPVSVGNLYGLAPQATPRQGLPVSSKGNGLTTEMAGVPQGASLDPEATLIEEKEKLQRLPSANALVSPGSQVYAYLDFEQAGVETQRLAITDPYVIVGRIDPKHGITPDIDLTPLDDQATVSRQHARIRFERTFFYLEDLKSRNKTRLGHLVLTPLKPELIQHGDEIWFGSLKMVFRLPGQPDMPLPKKLP